MIGTSWQVIANLTNDETPVGAVLPKEGSTGWSDTWMIAAKSAAPQLRLQVDGLHRLPEGQRPGGGVLRRGSGQPQGLQETSDKTFCDGYHAADAAYAAQLHYWTTPIKQCLDGRDVTCTDYAEWTKKWLEIKG